MPKLYSVKIEIVLCVAADSTYEAQKIAEHNYKNESVFADDFEIAECKLLKHPFTKGKFLIDTGSGDWSLEDIPYNRSPDVENKTIAEYRDDMILERKEQGSSTKLPSE